MDFSLNEVQAMLADSIEKFVANEYDFETRQTYAATDAGYSNDVWRAFAEFGWTAMPFSEDDGGFDGGAVETMVILERFGRGLVVEPYLANVILAGGILKRVANTAQKSTWLHPIISGDLQATLAFTEPHARYEINKIATSAKTSGDGWILNGSKGFVLNAGTADLIIVPVRTSGADDDEDGISFFALERGSDGLTIRDYPTVDGLRAAEVTLLNVKASPDRLIGDVGTGHTALEATIADATIAVCSEAVGIMNTLTEKTIDYAKTRTQFGVPISSFQALQHRMVEMYTLCEQTRSLLLWAVMAQETDAEESRRAVSAVKYQIGVAGARVAEEAVQIHGGMGVTWELDVSHYFKRLIAISRIFGNADWHLDRLAD